jgi:hypothetical protein
LGCKERPRIAHLPRWHLGKRAGHLVCAGGVGCKRPCWESARDDGQTRQGPLTSTSLPVGINITLPFASCLCTFLESLSFLLPSTINDLLISRTTIRSSSPAVPSKPSTSQPDTSLSTSTISFYPTGSAVTSSASSLSRHKFRLSQLSMAVVLGLLDLLRRSISICSLHDLVDVSTEALSPYIDSICDSSQLNEYLAANELSPSGPCRSFAAPVNSHHATLLVFTSSSSSSGDPELPFECCYLASKGRARCVGTRLRLGVNRRSILPSLPKQAPSSLRCSCCLYVFLCFPSRLIQLTLA